MVSVTPEWYPVRQIVRRVLNNNVLIYQLSVAKVVGGRAQGTPNKNKGRLLRKIQEEFPNYDPLIELVRIAHDIKSSLNEKIACNKEVAQYVNPKLKAVEHSGDMVVNHALLSKEEIKQRVKAFKRDRDDT